MDADTVIMNSEISLQDFLPSGNQYDFLLTKDDGGGYSAGAWIIRNSEWSLQVLESWWNLKSYVKPAGLARSGDNDALKALLHGMHDTFDQHCLVLARCTFNSFAKFVSPNEYDKVNPYLEQQSWYLSPDAYHKGDFVAHVAGIDNKRATLQMLLDMAQWSIIEKVELV